MNVIFLYLYDEEMKPIEMPKRTFLKSISISSLSKKRETQEVDGMPGQVDYGFTFESRTGVAEFYCEAYDAIDFKLLRNEIYDLFGSYNHLYVAEKELPSRFLRVHIDDSIEIEQFGIRWGIFNVNLTTTEIPFWQSIYTTKELNDTGYSAIVEKYGLVDGIHIDHTKYKFTERNFTVWNAGNVTIQPEIMYLNITILSPESTGNFTIHNITTGEKIIINRNLVSGNALYIDNMNISINSINIFRDTNKKYINLVPGENIFEITNGSFREINFDFRFYYK